MPCPSRLPGVLVSHSLAERATLPLVRHAFFLLGVSPGKNRSAAVVAGALLHLEGPEMTALRAVRAIASTRGRVLVSVRYFGKALRIACSLADVGRRRRAVMCRSIVVAAPSVVVLCDR